MTAKRILVGLGIVAASSVMSLAQTPVLGIIGYLRDGVFAGRTE